MGTEPAPSSFPVKHDPPHSRHACADRSRSVFAAIDSSNTGGEAGSTSQTDARRDDFLGISRDFSVILLVIYVYSRFYPHDPPGEGNAFTPRPDIPEKALEKERELEMPNSLLAA